MIVDLGSMACMHINGYPIVSERSPCCCTVVHPPSALAVSSVTKAVCRQWFSRDFLATNIKVNYCASRCIWKVPIDPSDALTVTTPVWAFPVYTAIFSCVLKLDGWIGIIFNNCGCFTIWASNIIWRIDMNSKLFISSGKTSQINCFVIHMRHGSLLIQSVLLYVRW